jgi:hypothetical protein
MRLLWLVLVLGGVASACSLLIEGEPMPLRCSQEGRVGPPACDPGMICRSGTCQVAEGDSGDGGSVSDPDDRRN